MPDDVWIDEDRFTFDDSDRFEDDSLCSWSSEPESLLNNWRGWKKPQIHINSFGSSGKKNQSDGVVSSLTELTARCVASHIPFELVERVYPPVPEQLQLRIAFWSFPDNEEDIRLYSCLANGSSEEFARGDSLFRNKAVRDPLQIGFHLSAKIEPTNEHPSNRGPLNVAVTFDRRRVTSCNCTCNSSAYWCAHVVAVCLHRINKPDTVTLRAPVSESLSRLHRDQLQKFAQYLISELPQQILPTAQRLLDELLSSQPSYINSVCGAPDPTAGASVTDQTSWYLDEKTLHENIKKIVIKFCVPAPIVFSDVNYLTTSAPPAASEWSSLLRPLRGREPEGMWNLLSIVREMYKRNDRNAVPLLSIITDECLNCEQILVWWFNTCVALHSGSGGGRHVAANSNSHTSQHACSSLCEEIVVLWKLAALNPAISPDERKLLEKKFMDWHAKIIEKVTKSRGNILGCNNAAGKLSAVDVFPGFTPAIQACQMDWEEYPLPGITYTSGTSPVYHCSFTCFRHNNETSHQVNSSEAVLNLHSYHHMVAHNGRRVNNVLEMFPAHREHAPSANRDGNRSSISSEGFCENENEADDAAAQTSVQYDTDSQEGGGSDSVSSSDACPDRQTPPSERRSLSSGSSKKLRAFVSKDQSSEESDAGVFTPGPSAVKHEANSVPSSPADWNRSPRRLCNESATSNSDDEGQKSVDGSDVTQEKYDEPEKPKEDPWNVLFARAEGLHAHGHGREACILAVRLALELLANPPNLMVEIPAMNLKGKKRKVNPISHQMSCLASVTLAKCAFLCAVLTEVPEHHSLAFRVGLFGLEMARPPASTKPLEVKLANQESELVVLVKRIPLGPDELGILRQKAQQLRDGTLRSRGEALLPIMLASFIFDALEGQCSVRDSKLPTDETLAFEAAVAALGLKANVSEADHPLLCEGTRRQRGELAITLLVHYKDEPVKLGRIMEKLLDREVHSLVKAPLSNWYTATAPQPRPHPPPAPPHMESLEMNPPPSMPPPPLEPSITMDLPPHGSRPHSTTSAELDQAMGGLSVSATPGPSSMVRSKDPPRFKGKRIYPSIPNQPSEAGAHFMFELAKVVLLKAGGSSSTSLFTQASTSQQHHGPHRALHICAFQIGLYALGLHNCVSPNWLSRTYSSHVSWITGQAMEIGAVAISFLIDTWEGHLTPPEAASIADRASRGCDPNMVRAAAELALSCLPHAHALNPNEITRAIVQCKEQSEAMLEHSCLTVETAAKGGGVYPEVLFQVAKYWYDLYVRQSGGNEGAMVEMDVILDPLPVHFSVDTHSGLLLVEQPQAPPPSGEIPPGGVVMASSPLLPVSYVTPYSFTLHPTFHQLYLTPPPYPLAPPQQYFIQPNPFPVGAMQPMGQNTNPIQLVQPPQNVAVAGVSVMPPPPNNLQPSMPNMQNMPPPGALVPVTVSQPVPGRPVHPPQVHRGGQNQYSPAQYHRCLLNSYRVGMLALETLARRVHDDRPQAKYARNPPYGDDVKWLLRVSKKLGTQYLHQFCYCVVNSIVSPFILYEVAVEAAHFLARNNTQLVLGHLRSAPALAPLISKSQQMYIQCLHQKLYHLNSADYEEFVNVVCSARSAFNITPDGAQQFKEWLSSIRRSKSCKKDLWTQINAALQSNSK